MINNYKMTTTNDDIFFKDEDEMFNCKICKLRMKQGLKRHAQTKRHQRNLKEAEQTNSEKIEVILPKKEFKIVTSFSYDKFKDDVEKHLNDGWIMHGYTHHKCELSNGRIMNGPYSQAFTKNVFKK